MKLREIKINEKLTEDIKKMLLVTGVQGKNKTKFYIELVKLKGEEDIKALAPLEQITCCNSRLQSSMGFLHVSNLIKLNKHNIVLCDIEINK